MICVDLRHLRTDPNLLRPTRPVGDWIVGPQMSQMTQMIGRCWERPGVSRMLADSLVALAGLELSLRKKSS